MHDKSDKTTELVLNVLDYAHEHNMDVNNKEDIIKILEVLDPTQRTDGEIREFMVLLKVTDRYFELKAPKKKSIKKNLPN